MTGRQGGSIEERALKVLSEFWMTTGRVTELIGYAPHQRDSVRYRLRRMAEEGKILSVVADNKTRLWRLP